MKTWQEQIFEDYDKLFREKHKKWLEQWIESIAPASAVKGHVIYEYRRYQEYGQGDTDSR